MRIKVQGKYYDYFDEFAIQTTLASVASTFGFRAYFDVNNPVHRILFKPLSYSTVQFYDDGDKGRLLSTGTILSHNMSEEAKPDLTQISGYSKSGIIEDCQISSKHYPLESNNLSLEQIAKKYCTPLGVNVIIYESVAKDCAETIKKSVARPEQTVKDYLTKIAAQKNVIISHDVNGNLIMFRPVISRKAALSITPTDGVRISLDINGQGIHSDLTSIRQPEKSTDSSNPFTKNYNNQPNFGEEEAKFKIQSISTVKNPLVGIFRPSVDVLSSGTFYNTLTAAKNRMASELENIQFSVNLGYWPNVSVGDVVEITAPNLFIRKPTKLVVSSTVISQNSKSKSWAGTLVLPETFTGETPKNIFA